MTGIVLPHDTYGSHLVNGQTVDTELEKKNFKAAGETLSELWSNLTIDNHEVKAEYVENPAKVETKEHKVSPAFRSRHVFETQYMVAYMKCDDRTCCAAPKTSVMYFFPHRRLPSLIPIKKTAAGMVPLALTPEVYKSHIEFPTLSTRVLLEETITPEELTLKYGKSVPYDVYLPSCQEKIEGRTCKVCYKYHATKKSLQIHKKVCKRSKTGGGSTKKLCRNTRGRNTGKGRAGTMFEDSGSDLTDEEQDINNSIHEDDVEEKEDDLADLETTSARPTYSIAGEGGVETILNLREWLKSPWADMEEGV
jgi:hypothetical protein